MCWTTRWTRITTGAWSRWRAIPTSWPKAVLRGVGKAMELIDLNEHKGAHPRVGATDVVPFIPIHGVTLDDCAALARRVGKEIWTRYRIPVFFYEAAATRPERVNLENIRKGQFEGLRDELKKNHDRQPDVGEPKLHPTAGVTVVGARKFLIAYNVNLNTLRCGHRQQDCEGDSLFVGRAAVREVDGRGFEGAKPGAGVDQSDRFRADADASRVRDGEARGGTLRRGAGGQRDRRADSEKSDRDGGGLFSASGEFFAGAGV